MPGAARFVGRHTGAEEGADSRALRTLQLASRTPHRAEDTQSMESHAGKEAPESPGWRMGVSRWVSIVAHPFVTTLVLVGTVELDRGPVAAGRALATVALLVVLPVAVLMSLQVRRGAWGTVDASHPRERPLLFMVGGAGILALLGYLAVAHPDSPLLRGAAGTLVMVAVCAVMTRWVKVSLHMATATLAASALVTRGAPVGWLLALVLPVLAWSRVALGRHRWIEVALGFAVGAATGVWVARAG